MSKQTRNKLILLLLALILVGVVIVANNNAPNMTAGLRDVINRDDTYYKNIVIQTMTADALQPPGK